MCACFSVHSFGYTPRTSRAGSDWIGSVWSGALAVGHCLCFCRFWLGLGLRRALLLLCLRLEPNMRCHAMRFTGHLSELYEWLTVCLAVVCALTAGSVGLSGCRSVGVPVGGLLVVPCCKWSGQGGGASGNCRDCCAGKTSEAQPTQPSRADS